MRILVVSDLHGDLDSVRRAYASQRPELILSCGDWGDADQVTEPALAALLEARRRLHHLRQSRPARDPGSVSRIRTGRRSCWPREACSDVGGLRLAAIGGIWAKSHAKPHYVTDADVAVRQRELPALGRSISCSLTAARSDWPTSRRPAPRRPACLLDAFKTISPRLHLCGHLHLAQEHILKDGRKVINVGATPEGSMSSWNLSGERRTLDLRLERVPSS